jgi:hypothetical protein
MINNVLMAVVVAWTASFFFATMFQCSDPHVMWSTFEYARVECVQSVPLYYSLAITGVLTDFAILASPLPVIRQLQMPREARIGTACILLLGAV